MNATEHKSIGVLRTISTPPSYYHLRFAIRWSTALCSTNWLPIFRKRAGVSGKKNIHRLTWTTTINTTINSLLQKLYQDRVTCYDQVSLKTFVEESALVSEIWHRWSLKCSAAPCPVQISTLSVCVAIQWCLCSKTSHHNNTRASYKTQI